MNRFGVIPEGHNTGKWRLITDLSFPPGRSVNDGVDPDLCSLTYTTVDHVAEIAVSLGKGTLLAKQDIESAYCLVPVHPQDRKQFSGNTTYMLTQCCPLVSGRPRRSLCHSRRLPLGIAAARDCPRFALP